MSAPATRLSVTADGDRNVLSVTLAGRLCARDLDRAIATVDTELDAVGPDFTVLVDPTDCRPLPEEALPSLDSFVDALAAYGPTEAIVIADEDTNAIVKNGIRRRLDARGIFHRTISPVHYLANLETAPSPTPL